MKIANRLRGRNNRQRGALAETIAMRSLQTAGVRCAHLETGWRVKRVGSRIVGATPTRSVLADIVGVLHGRAVLCEVKAEDGPTLSLSRLEPHQRDNLTAWAQAGALVLVAWVQLIPEGERCAFVTHYVRLIRWPCAAWSTGHPLTERQALTEHIAACGEIHKETSP